MIVVVEEEEDSKILICHLFRPNFQVDRNLALGDGFLQRIQGWVPNLGSLVNMMGLSRGFRGSAYFLLCLGIHLRYQGGRHLLDLVLTAVYFFSMTGRRRRGARFQRGWPQTIEKQPSKQIIRWEKKAPSFAHEAKQDPR